MRSISKAQQREIDKAVEAMQEAAGEIETLVEQWNEITAPLREQIEAAVESYNEKLADLKSVYADIGSVARDQYNERSQRWQDSDAGQTYSEWVDALEDPAIEELEFELPDELGSPDFPDFEDDSWLPAAEPGEA